jgi:hypothetical protein
MSPGNVEDIPATFSRIVSLNRYLSAAYPGIRLRWAQIYGARWAHLLGEVHELTAIPLRLQINQNYGLLIENPEILGQEDVDFITSVLKGEFGK